MDSTFDLLTLALLPGTRSRTARERRGADPPGRGPGPSRRARRLSRSGRGRPFESGAARRAAEAEMRAPHARGVAPRRLGRAFVSPAPAPGLRSPARALRPGPAPGRTKEPWRRRRGRSRCRRRRARRSPAPWRVTWPPAVPPSCPAWPGASTPRPTRERSTAKGRTVAVLGSGLDSLYPPENAGLAAADRGSRARWSRSSRWARRPQPRNFPRRNRIIAGWGAGGGRGRGGASAAVRWSRRAARSTKAGRSWPCPAIPPADSVGGTNALIRDGAVLVRDRPPTWPRPWAWPPGAVSQPHGRRRAAAARPAPRDAPSRVEELSSRSGTPTPPSWCV